METLSFKGLSSCHEGSPTTTLREHNEYKRNITTGGVFVILVTLPNSIGSRKEEIQESYVIILRFNGANDDRRLFIAMERNIVLVVHFDILFIQDTNDLTDIIDECKFVAKLMLIRVHNPVCQQIFQCGHLCIRCSIVPPKRGH